MRELNGRDLHYEAKSALADAKFPPQKIALVYILVSLIPSLLLDILSYYVSGVVDRMTQLSDLMRRSGLSSLVITLSVLIAIFSIFWSYSYTVFTLRASRREDFSYDTLWDGFRLWKRVIGSMFWLLLRYLGISFAFALIAIPLGMVSIFLFTLCSVAYVVLVVYLAYRYWAVHFLAVDNTMVPTSALCGISSRLMEGRKWQVFKVELHFLWYSILLSLVQAIPGILIQYTQGFVPYLSLVLFQVAGSFLLYMWKMNEVNVTFAMTYNTLLKEDMAESQPENGWGNSLPENTDL